MTSLKDFKNKFSLSHCKISSTEETVLENVSEVTKNPEQVVTSFLKNESKWEAAYNPTKLLDIITHYAKKAGITTIFYALLLYQALKSDKISGMDKTLALAALGYFISPLDLIPDWIPSGLFDDTVILFYAIDKLGEAIDSETKAMAKNMLGRWFNDSEIFEISKNKLSIANNLKKSLKKPLKLVKQIGKK